jgi:CDP-diacylglycerol--inositol 3-phosphatidyltransferase
VLFLFCFLNEVFFVCAYLSYYERTPIHSSVIIKSLFAYLPLYQLGAYLPGPIVWVFQYIGSVSWAQFIGALTLPVMAGKQLISIIQFWKASKVVRIFCPSDDSLLPQLVGVDLAERQAAREAKAAAERGR